MWGFSCDLIPIIIGGLGAVTHKLKDRGGHTGLFLEIPYETLESGGLLNVEKDRKKIGYPCLKEK